MLPTAAVSSSPGRAGLGLRYSRWRNRVGQPVQTYYSLKADSAQSPPSVGPRMKAVPFFARVWNALVHSFPTPLYGSARPRECIPYGISLSGTGNGSSPAADRLILRKRPRRPQRTSCQREDNSKAGGNLPPSNFVFSLGSQRPSLPERHAYRQSWRSPRASDRRDGFRIPDLRSPGTLSR